MKKAKTSTIKCYRCSGTGKLPHYSHIAEGACFLCMGAGVIPAAKARNMGFSKQVIISYYGVSVFPDMPYFRAMPGMDMLQVIMNNGHATAEYQVLKDGKYYYVGQPVCGGSTWYAVPLDHWPEFRKHWNRCNGKFANISESI